MSDLTLYGASYSVYSRIPRLVLAELQIPHAFVEIDIFDKENLPSDYPARHPFSKIPALDHDGFLLFETDAIAHYLIETFEGAALLPETPPARARARQVMRIMDNYGYPRLVWGVMVEELERGRAGSLSDEEVTGARQVLQVLDDLADAPYLLGDRVTLADLWTVCVTAYLALAPTGAALLAEFPALLAWSSRMAERPSVAATRYPRETEVS